MTGRRSFLARTISILCGTLLISAVSVPLLAQPSRDATAAFDRYTAALEARLGEQHQSAGSFLASENAVSLRQGGPVIENLTPGNGDIAPGALLHDWRGTAFIPGATASQFEQFLKCYNAYPQEFAPQVLRASVLRQDGNRMQVQMRIRQHHGMTVILDTDYDVTFGRLDSAHRYSISRSTKISELDSSGRAIPQDEEHGFLWRMNTYWTYEEKAGGLYVQIETVSLSRSIPTGLGWIVGPFVQSIPRASMEFTLRSAFEALRTERDKS